MSLQTVNPSEVDGVVERLRDGGFGKTFTENRSPYMPNALAKRILDSVVYQDKNIIVYYTLELACELYARGANNVTVATTDPCPETRRITELLGYKYTLINNIKDSDMKNSVIVGNPPFQRTDNKAKRWTLWEEFVNISLEQADVVCLVVPQSITGPGPVWERIRKHTKIINTDIKHHFSVNSTFCYFVVDQTIEFSSTKIISADGEFDVDIRELPFIPNIVNDDSLALLGELVNRPKRVWKRGELHTSHSEKFDTTGQYKVMHTNAQTLYSNIEHPNRQKIRVAVTLSGYPKFEVLENAYCSQACFWTEFTNIDEARQFAEECNGPEIQKVVGTFKWSGWNSKEVISML